MCSNRKWLLRSIAIRPMISLHPHNNSVCVSPSVMSGSLQPPDWSLSAYSIHGIFQARILEWVAITYSRESSWPRDWTWSLALQTDSLLSGNESESHSKSLQPHGLSRWWSRRTCTLFLLRELQNYNSLLNNHQQENVGSHWKRISHIQGQRRSPSKLVGGMKLCLESNPISAREAWRAQTKPCAHQETPQRLS